MQPHPANINGISGDTFNPSSVQPQLSPRQFEAIQGLADGKSRAQIARDMHISLHTLKSYMYIAFRRLGARNAPEAVAIMARMQMLDVVKQSEPCSASR